MTTLYDVESTQFDDLTPLLTNKIGSMPDSHHCRDNGDKTVNQEQCWTDCGWRAETHMVCVALKASSIAWPLNA